MKVIDQHAASSASSRDNLESSSWLAVVRSYLECSRRYGQMLEHFDLTTTQFDVLMAIDSLGEGAVPKTIAERLLVTRANITGVLKRLQQQQLVSTRTNESDSRSFVCALTIQGRDVRERAHAASLRFIHAQLAPFDDKELGGVDTLMRRMHVHLKTLDPEALAMDDAPIAAQAQFSGHAPDLNTLQESS